RGRQPRRQLPHAVQQDHPDLLLPGARQEDEDEAGGVHRAGKAAAADPAHVVVTGAAFAERLIGAGFDLFAGVPCSLVEGVIAALERHPGLPYIAAVREDVAVGVAGGAWLAGRRPAVIMQNSGLGTSLNALASFSLMYGLPALLVVTWRGQAGQDAPEHRLMGEITPGLLDLLGIPHRVLTRDGVDEALNWAVSEMDARLAPVALVVPAKLLSHEASTAPAHSAAPARAVSRYDG